MAKAKNETTGLEIAVIGMAGRFPAACNIHQFWENLKNGIESVTFFSEEELQEVGVDSHLIKNPDYIKAKAIIQEIEYFDASFFDYFPGEVKLMDPQMRIFHECAWEALEDGGYDPGTYQGLIGLYGGASTNTYWTALALLSQPENSAERFAIGHIADKDFLCTQVSYKLNLKGPSVFLKTACSTSLVAIHAACRGLLTGECDMALAGGITVAVPQKSGGLYQQGMILAPDGHCRAFDAEAAGIVGGEGAGVALLKPLKFATAHRDHIYAVIKGSAINNDGSRKVGYTSPSVAGQAEVIKAALRMAQVEPESITYIEAHGTGTELGDPVEIEGLKLGFNTDKKQFCRIGSVKSNIGHLDSAAGVVGFIKTVLALKHRLIPPSLHFKTPNPEIDFENSPFIVNDVLTPWEHDHYPLRAGVSSFGIGGTNVHVVLEEAPEGTRGLAPLSTRQYQLILLSAKTSTALDKITENLTEYLKKNIINPGNPGNPTNPGLTLADAAYTLQVGRKAFPHRKMAVCSNINQVVETLSSPDSREVQSFTVKEEKIPVVFMFPGQGSQYVNMGLGLYRTEPVFREEMDRCFKILNGLLDYDIKEILYPNPYPQDCAEVPGKGYHRGSRLQSLNSDQINQTEIAQTLLFIFEYSLAKLLMHWGIKPYAMIGHSIGEYVAACLSGVFSFKDALILVTVRGKLMRQLPGGSMVSIRAPENEIKLLLEQETGLALAAVNAPSFCVVSGEDQAVKKFQEQLKENGVDNKRLKTSHAFHSQMMESILNQFEAQVKKIHLNKPQIPYISNMSGQWIQVKDAVNPGYWVQHLRRTIRFSDGIAELLKSENSIFVEVGPGNVLSTFVKKHGSKKLKPLALNLIRHPRQNVSDSNFILNKIGELWIYGVNINWSVFYSEETRYRISLPTYPFERQRYWLEGDPLKIEKKLLSDASMRNNTRKADMADWFYIPSWKRSAVPGPGPIGEPVKSCCLAFLNNSRLVSLLVKGLEQKGAEVITVKPGPAFRRLNQREYIINATSENDYQDLCHEMQRSGKMPDIILHSWCVGEDTGGKPGIEGIPSILDLGFYSLLNIVKSLEKENQGSKIQLMVLSDNMQSVTGEESLCPYKVTLMGPCRVIAKEFPHIKCRSIDVIIPTPGSKQEQRLLGHLLAELTMESADTVIAYRGNHRWKENFEPIHLESTEKWRVRLKDRGVYLITGGLGGIGLVLARHLAAAVKARLILTGRSPFPLGEEWPRWLETHDPDDDVSVKIKKIQELKELGAEVLVIRADISNKKQMQEMLRQVNQRFGSINGVIHSAGVPDGRLIQLRTKEMSRSVLAPKVDGTLILDSILRDVSLDFFVLCSSLSSIVTGVGQVAYTAANAFLDAFAFQKASNGGPFTVSIGWEGWKEVGMAVEAAKQLASSLDLSDFRTLLQDEGLSPDDGINVFLRVLGCTHPLVLVSTQDLNTRISTDEKPEFRLIKEVEKNLGNANNELEKSLLPPVDTAEVERQLIELFQGVIELQELSVDDDFFDIGMDSLTLVRIYARINTYYPDKLKIQDMFDHRTIKQIAWLIMKTDKPGTAAVEEAGIEDIEF